MVFLAPLVLFGLLADLIPVAIHLIRRERPPKVVLGSIRFLKNTPKKLILFQQLQQWLLLLLRSLLIALLVLAFARPLVNQALARLVDADPQSAVLVLDASLSMHYDESFARALDEARGFVDGLAPSDEVALIVLGDSATVTLEFSEDREAISAALDALKEASYGAATLTRGMQLADELLASAQYENRALVVVSDFQESASAGIDGSWKLAPSVELILRDVGVESSSNLSVVDVRSPQGTVAGGRLEPVLARIRSTGTLPLTRAQASLRIDGETLERIEVDLTGVSERVIEFSTPLDAYSAVGEHRLEVRIEGDSFSADNGRFAVLAVEPQLNVLVVNGESAQDWYDDEAHWFLLASGAQGSSPYAVSEILPANLTRQMLDDTDVVAMLNVASLDALQASALGDFVTRGGGLLVALGDQASPTNSGVEDMLPATLVNSPRLNAGDYRLVADFERRHPLFARLSGEWTTRFSRVWALAPKADAQVLMRFDNATPALIEGTLGAGRILMSAMPLDSEWGDLPLQPHYLPFVRESLTYLAARPPIQRDFYFGDAALARRALDEASGDSVTPGFLSLGSEDAVLVAVNTSVEESSLARRPASAVFDAVINPEVTSLAPREVRTAQRSVELENPQRLWWWILCLVMVLLLAETGIANRTTR
jgi:hypothetical protein